MGFLAQIAAESPELEKHFVVADAIKRPTEALIAALQLLLFLRGLEEQSWK